MEWHFIQQHVQEGGGGGRVVEHCPQLSLKQEQLIHQVRHEHVVVDNLWEVAAKLPV